MKTVVFLGPSLPYGDALSILPNAVYLPPARQADVVSAVETYRPDVLALIDGSFGQTLSVWHKELLFALDRGVRVYGAASIGALRAAELASFGMLGVGEVFRKFASGEIQDDDEVALVHASAAEGYQPLSEPMVNLRATFTAARDQGVLTSAECDLLLATAKAQYFAERTLPRTLEGCYVDLKRSDAEQVLRVIRDLPDPLPPPSPSSFRFERSASFDTLYENERFVPQDGIDVPLRAIATYAALHHPAFDELNFAALNNALVQVLADLLHVEATPADVDAETRRFRRHRGLDTDPAFETWLVRQHLSRESFEALLRELATARRLQRWLLVRDRGTRHTRWLLDELRRRGEYEAVAASAAEQHAVLESLGPDQLEDVPEQVGLTPLANWAEEAGFESAQDLALEVARAARVRARLQAAARALAGAVTSSESR